MEMQFLGAVAPEARTSAHAKHGLEGLDLFWR
jgi:hypothetical protein